MEQLREGATRILRFAESIQPAKGRCRRIEVSASQTSVFCLVNVP